MSTPIEIVRTQTLDLQAGKWAPGEKVFVQVYGELVTSGLLADLHGSELKILLALALHAVPLGVNPHNRDAAQQVFAEFYRKGLVGPEDLGNLCCFLPHEGLIRITGLSENTVTKYATALVRRNLIEKRTVRCGSRVRNIYFILPATHIDKFNTYHSKPSPEATAANLAAVTTATAHGNAANYITPPLVDDFVVPAARGKLDDQAILAHFATRKGVPSYRPTAHDRKRLAELQAQAYSQAQVIAAIDQAFDERPADAPPIRQFSYCARIVLSGPPHAAVTTAAPEVTYPATGNQAPPDGALERRVSVAPIAPDTPTFPASPDTPPVLERAIQLHRQEIGPLTPLMQVELERLVQHHPDLAQWEHAFHVAAMANVQRLDYVAGVLRNTAQQTPNGGSKKHEPPKRHAGADRRQRKRVTRKKPSWTAREMATAQERARSVRPLDVGELLGSADA